MDACGGSPLAVVPVLIGPLQALLAMLPVIFAAIGTAMLSLFKPSTMKALGQFFWTQKIGAMTFLLVLGGGLYAMGFASFGPDVSGREAGSDWIAFRGGPQRLGFVVGDDEPTRQARIWSYEDPATFYASPTVVGNRVYITSAKKETFADNGKIICIDADNGGEAWEFAPKKFKATFSSPAVAGKYLVVGEGLHYTENARVVCVEVGEKKATKLWEFPTRSHVESSPCIDLKNKRVYIGAGDDGYYCFALDGDGNGEAKVLWHLKGKKSTDPNAMTNDKGQIYADAETSPIVHDDKVYFGLGLTKGDEDAQAIVCVDAETGKEHWRLETPYPVFGSPSICNNKLFVGMGWGDFVNRAEAIGKDPVGEVWCVDISGEKPDVLWKFPAKRTVLGSVAATKDLVYFGDRAGVFYCVSVEHGTLEAEWDAGQPIVTSPALAEKHVYFVTTAGRLYCLTTPRLKPAWNLLLGTGGLFMSSPAVARGHVYVGTGGKGLLCVGEVGPPPPPVWVASLGGAEKSGWSDGSPPPKRTRDDWRFPKSKSEAGEANPRSWDAPPITAPVAVIGNNLYVGSLSNGKPGLTKMKLQLAEKNRKNRRTVEWELKTTNAVTISAVATERDVFVVDGKVGDSDRLLRCVDAANGNVKWDAPVADDAPGTLLLDGSRLFVLASADGVTCFAADGSEAGRRLWSAATGPVIGTPVAGDEFLLIAQRDPNRLLVLGSYNGAVLREISLPRAPTTGPILAGLVAQFGDGEGVHALNVITGKSVWNAACGAAVESLACNDNWIVAVTAKNEAVFLMRDSGKEPADLRVKDVAADAAVAPMLCGMSRNKLILLHCDSKREVLRAAAVRQIVVKPAVKAKPAIEAKPATETRPAIEAQPAVEAKKAEMKYVLKIDEVTSTKKGMKPGRVIASPVMVESHLCYVTERKGMVCGRP